MEYGLQAAVDNISPKPDMSIGDFLSVGLVEKKLQWYYRAGAQELATTVKHPYVEHLPKDSKPLEVDVKKEITNLIVGVWQSVTVGDVHSWKP